jgi:hypothetical protein
MRVNTEPRTIKISTLLELVILAAILIGVGSTIYGWLRVEWTYSHIEQKARRVVTATELQAWATHLVADYPPDNYPTRASMRSNLPPAQLHVAPGILGPFVIVDPPMIPPLPGACESIGEAVSLGVLASK